MGSKLAQDDKVQVYEAIAYVISAMPMEQAANSLRQFALDILAVVHNITSKPSAATKEELKTAAGMLAVIRFPMLYAKGCHRCAGEPGSHALSH